MYDESEFTTTAEFLDENITAEFKSDVFDETPSVVMASEDFSEETLGTVNAREVYIRKGPEKHFDAIGTVKLGDIVTVLGRDGNFLKIETPDGVEAYIMESFVTVD